MSVKAHFIQKNILTSTSDDTFFFAFKHNPIVKGSYDDILTITCQYYNYHFRFNLVLVFNKYFSVKNTLFLMFQFVFLFPKSIVIMHGTTFFLCLSLFINHFSCLNDNPYYHTKRKLGYTLYCIIMHCVICMKEQHNVKQFIIYIVLYNFCCLFLQHFRHFFLKIYYVN